MTAAPPVGFQLRQWRERRRLSQLELASQADVSTRHLSFVETGRSRPTKQMIIKLTEHLEIPLRERNQLLLAGGFAPAYPQHDLDEPELARVRAALRRVLRGHEPYPATVVNRWWELVDANDAVGALLVGVAPHLLEPPVNVLRLSLHPDGLAPRIVNLGQWRAHLVEQLNRRRVATGDARLHELAEELRSYPGDDGSAAAPTDVVLPLVFRHDIGELSMFSIAASVGTATDVTVEELQIESFYPADESTAQLLQQLRSRAPS
jgi:transcriptional regulator with XRE-family HTH domain